MKKTSYAKTGAIICGLGNAFLNLMKQLNEMDQDPDQKFKWGEFLASVGKGAALGGLAGFGIGAVRDYQNSLEQPIDLNAHLFAFSGLLMLDKSDPQFKAWKKLSIKYVVSLLNSLKIKSVVS